METKEKDPEASQPSEVSSAAVEPSNDALVAGHRLARLGDRLLAVILDTLLIAGVFALTGMWAAARWGGVTEKGFSLEGTPALVTISLTLLVGFLYYWILEGTFGATLGKAMIGIQVRGKDGGSCGMRPSLIRNLFRIVDGIGVYLLGFLVAVFSRLRQRIGDHLARTVVVEMSLGKALRGFLVFVWVASLAGEIWGAYRIHSHVPASAVQPSSSASTQPSSRVSPSLAVTTGDLKIINFAFLQSKDGPARSEAPYRSGEKIFTSYNVAGFTADQSGQMHLVILSSSSDPGGLPLLAPLKYEMNEAVTKSSALVSGYFNLDLPPYAPGGKYTIQIKVHDSVKNTDTEQTRTFNVEAEATPSATQLEFRDFHFSLSEDGSPVDSPVIPPGGTVYSTCKVAGMQFREGRPDVHVALQVTGPGGEIVLDKPDFLKVKDQYPYHPPTFFQRILARATLPSNAPAGKYTWKYTMTDRIASSTVREERQFEVR